MSLADKVNITLGFISNYCTIKYTQYNSSLVSNLTEVYDASFLTLNDNSGWIYWNDVGLMAAVNKVNKDASILPGVHVNVKRFTDCGPWDPAAAENYAGKSGGYASAVMAMDIAEVYTDVIGVIGNEYSSVTKETAEILSHYQIPYCSLISGSPSLSNKHKYPYLWRTLPISFARSFGLILSEWKVKRIGIIYQKDDLFSSAMFKQCMSLFKTLDLTVVTSIALVGRFDSAAIQYTVETITRTDSRYNIILGQRRFLSKVILPLGQAGLVGSKHVWLSNNPPFPLSSSGQNMEFLRGIIAVTGAYSSHGRIWMEAYEASRAIAKSFIGPFDFDNNLPNGYDCVMMMLLGFDKILKSDETFTLEALSKRKLQSELNYTHFMNLNYSGALFDPMILDDSGDLLGPFTYESFTGDFLNFSTFALSNTEGTSLNLYNSSVSIFYNGSSIPPPDGSVPLPQMSYTLQTPEGIAILSISTLGLVMGMLAIGYLITFQNEMVVKSISLPETLQLIIGCVSSYIALFLYLNPVTSAACKVRSVILVLAIALVLLPIVFKTIFLIAIFTKGMAYKNANFLKELRNKFRQLNASLFLLDLGLCIAWTIKSKLSLVQIQTETFSFLSCQVQTNGITATLYTVNILLFVGLILVIIQQSTVESSAHDESTTLTVIAVSIAIGFTLIEILSSYGTDFHSDFHVVLCIWAFTTVVLLAVIVPVIIVVMQDYRHKSQKTKVTIAKSELNGTGRESASRDVPTFSRASITTSKQTNLASKADNQKSVLLGDQLQSGENTTRLGERSPAGAKKSQLGETSPLLGRSHQKGEQPLFSTHCQRAVYKFMPLQQKSDLIVWRAWKSGQMLWSPWYLGIVSSHSINGQKVWLSIASLKRTSCFPLSEGNLPIVRGNRVNVQGKGSKKGSKNDIKLVQMEFQDNAHANSFVEELMESFPQIGVEMLSNN